MKITNQEFEAAISKATDPDISIEEWKTTKNFLLKCQVAFRHPHAYIPQVSAALSSLEHNKPSQKSWIKKNWPTLSILGFILASVFSGIGTKYLPDSLLFWDVIDYEKTELNPVQEQVDEGLIIESNQLPYNDKKPILDHNLYISQNYSELHFGGVNFELVKLAIRNDNGEKGTILRISSELIVAKAFETPYIEFNYKDRNYAIDIDGDFYSDGELYLTYQLMQITSPSMKLKSYNEL